MSISGESSVPFNPESNWLWGLIPLAFIAVMFLVGVAADEVTANDAAEKVRIGLPAIYKSSEDVDHKRPKPTSRGQRTGLRQGVGAIPALMLQEPAGAAHAAMIRRQARRGEVQVSHGARTGAYWGNQ